MKYFLTLLLPLLLLSCTPGPKAIEPGKDQCRYCKMTIMEPHFAAEFVTQKGKVFVFDDIKCLALSQQDGSLQSRGTAYYVNYFEPSDFIPQEQVHLLKSEELRTPMAGNVVAVRTENEKSKLKTEKGAIETSLHNAFH